MTMAAADTESPAEALGDQAKADEISPCDNTSSDSASTDNTASDKAIYAVVEAMLSDALPIKKHQHRFTPDTLLDDIGMDSLEVLSVAMDLEEHFEVFIPDEQVNSFKQVKDIADYLQTLLSQTTEPAADQVSDQASESSGDIEEQH
ncbi:acyl carrier protein [Oceanicoccus sagamiensis]|uniref:Carrier domain-containing protein n=1 Tax=Oceanicoccus sagamiensis TaxID=716816 RepID=A0A1X9N9B1_9GAMM|nr:phosphopantetheine-binding protein [Oceanicoccus sagamiensis]ARN73771.1 hypothetical protein BST96_06370 [Oceanicoccus sagamiensis]